MEMVAQAINLLNGHGVKADKVQVGEIETHVLLGLNPGLINASGYSCTADYVTVTGDLCADLPSNIASEQRAKVVYEYLYRQIEDKKVRETVDFLLNREEAHNQMFRDAFNEVRDSGSNRDFGTTKAAKMYFSLQPRPQRLRGKRSDRTQVCKIMKSPLISESPWGSDINGDFPHFCGWQDLQALMRMLPFFADRLQLFSAPCLYSLEK